jgi:hypothetical protein
MSERPSRKHFWQVWWLGIEVLLLLEWIKSKMNTLASDWTKFILLFFPRTKPCFREVTRHARNVPVGFWRSVVIFRNQRWYFWFLFCRDISFYTCFPELCTQNPQNASGQPDREACITDLIIHAHFVFSQVFFIIYTSGPMLKYVP